MNFIFSFTRNKCLKEFRYYNDEENSINFFNLANYSIYRASLFGQVYVYTTESEINHFIKNIHTAKVIYKIIPENHTFFWAISKFYSLSSFINEYNKPCLHLDFDLFLNKEFIFGEPGLIISHGEPYSDPGVSSLDKLNIPRSVFLNFYNEIRNRLVESVGFEDIIKWLEIGYTYNTSIFGGYDTSLVLKICDKILTAVNENNEQIMSLVRNQDVHSILFTAVYEQAHLAYICKQEGILPVSYGWPGNYLHFYSHTKNDPVFISKMNELIYGQKYSQVDPELFFK